ncbi:hypothetical protein A3K73_01515 [Candidatus Pacearchaeota archaeon RBG_13_36_9]|nr:MAG: hypothetical protein A3K73_01515 [Candidatus Pacearchaeota archaeon RBG_13_36_9]
MPPVRMQDVMEQLLTISVGMEIIYSFVIILCSLMVYYGTKELYELTNHKGIKYFRLSFLFFAIAYFFRSFIKFLVYFFGVNAVREIPQFIAPLTLFVFIYASSMAVFYLFYSMVYRKWENKSYLFHIFAVIIAIIILLSDDASWLYLGINFILFLLLAVGICIMHRNKKENKKNRFFIVYILLFAFWLLNVVDILIPTIIGTYQLTVYLISLGIFMLILFKVLKRAG